MLSTLTAITITLGSLHVEHDGSVSDRYEDANPGVLLHVPAAPRVEAIVGAYANSKKRTSALAGARYSLASAGPFEVSASAGLVTGYRSGARPMLFAAIGFSVHVDRDVSLNATFVPGVGESAHAVNFSTTWRW